MLGVIFQIKMSQLDLLYQLRKPNNLAHKYSIIEMKYWLYREKPTVRSLFSVSKKNYSMFQLELNDITLLHDYIHLRYLYFSSNQIQDITPLSGMKQMVTLILDRNKIESFKLPKMEYLQVSCG